MLGLEFEFVQLYA